MVAIISFVIPRFRKTVICDIWHIKNNGCRKRKRTFGNHEVSNFKVYCAKSLHIFHQTQSEADIPLITSNRSYLEFHLDVIYMVKRYPKNDTATRSIIFTTDLYILPNKYTFD